MVPHLMSIRLWSTYSRSLISNIALIFKCCSTLYFPNNVQLSAPCLLVSPYDDFEFEFLIEELGKCWCRFWCWGEFNEIGTGRFLIFLSAGDYCCRESEPIQEYKLVKYTVAASCLPLIV